MVLKKRVATRVRTLTDLLAEGQKTGELRAAQVEASLLSTVPDASELSLFLDLTRTLVMAHIVTAVLINYTCRKYFVFKK